MTINGFEDVPTELFISIVGAVPVPGLLVLRQVCKQWQALTEGYAKAQGSPDLKTYVKGRLWPRPVRDGDLPPKPIWTLFPAEGAQALWTCAKDGELLTADWSQEDKWIVTRYKVGTWDGFRMESSAIQYFGLDATHEMVDGERVMASEEIGGIRFVSLQNGRLFALESGKENTELSDCCAGGGHILTQGTIRGGRQLFWLEAPDTLAVYFSQRRVAYRFALPEALGGRSLSVIERGASTLVVVRDARGNYSVFDLDQLQYLEREEFPIKSRSGSVCVLC